MTRISKFKLQKDTEKEMFTLFWSSLTQLRQANDVASFFSDLLSDTEEIMLVKRFTIALLLLRGKRPVEIASTLHVSFSTIRSVGEWISRATPATQKLFEQVLHVQQYQAVLDRLEGLLDELPSRWSTDWSAVGKAKWKRKIGRVTREQLR